MVPTQVGCWLLLSHFVLFFSHLFLFYLKSKEIESKRLPEKPKQQQDQCWVRPSQRQGLSQGSPRGWQSARSQEATTGTKHQELTGFPTWVAGAQGLALECLRVRTHGKLQLEPRQYLSRSSNWGCRCRKQCQLLHQMLTLYDFMD